MNEVLRKIVASASDAHSLVGKLSEEGINSVRGTWEQLPIVSSLRARAVDELDRDETHYVLVPQPDGKRPVLYTKRILPPGVGAMNSLPRARVFHVPDSSAASLAETLLIEEEAKNLSTENSSSSSLGEALDRFGESVDSASESLTGGLLLLGGAVIWFNPVAGSGIALAGWVAQLGAKLATNRLGALGRKISSAQHEREQRKHAKLATKEVKRLQPEVHENALLRALDAVFTEAGLESPATRYDPNLDRELWPDAFPSAYVYQLSVEAAQASLPTKNWLRDSVLTPAQRRWLKDLVEYEFEEA